LGSESETCVGSRVHLVGVSISFEKNFYRLTFTPPLSGSSYRSFSNSLINWDVCVKLEKNPFFANNKNTNELTNRKMHPMQSRPGDGSPQPWHPWSAHQAVGPGTPRAKLRFARGAQRCTTETLPRSRPGRTLGRDFASLEGWTPPRARLRLARGSRGSATPTPTPPTGALNALTQCGRPGQRRIPTMPAH
jgi:hypothetical protein